MRRKLASVVLLLMMSVVLAGSGRMESYNLPLTAATADTAEEVGAVVLVDFQRLVQERTNGYITVTLNTDGVFGGDRELIKGLQRGTVDLITCTAFKYAEYVPEFAVLDLPFLFFLHRTFANGSDRNFGTGLDGKSLGKRGDYVLGYITDGPVNIASNRALASLSRDAASVFARCCCPHTVKPGKS